MNGCFGSLAALQDNISSMSASGAKVVVQERREWPTDNGSVGLMPANQITGLYVSEILVEDGVITITYGNNAHTSIQGHSVTLVPDASSLPTVSWNCYSLEIANKWLPAACRSN
jgi:type IV pilus assembly protein PilA